MQIVSICMDFQILFSWKNNNKKKKKKKKKKIASIYRLLNLSREW